MALDKSRIELRSYYEPPCKLKKLSDLVNRKRPKRWRRCVAEIWRVIETRHDDLYRFWKITKKPLFGRRNIVRVYLAIERYHTDYAFSTYIYWLPQIWQSAKSESESVGGWFLWPDFFSLTTRKRRISSRRMKKLCRLKIWSKTSSAKRLRGRLRLCRKNTGRRLSFAMSKAKATTTLPHYETRTRHNEIAYQPRPQTAPG